MFDMGRHFLLGRGVTFGWVRGFTSLCDRYGGHFVFNMWSHFVLNKGVTFCFVWVVTLCSVWGDTLC